MMVVISALALTLLSAAYIWLHKPQSEKPEQVWSGIAAAYFLVGLVGASFGFLRLIAPEQPGQLSLMLEQLTLYAAVPLVACIQAAQAAGLNWSRQIWGRILLAVAATFELCRRADVLHEMFIVGLALGAVALVANLARNKTLKECAHTGAWLATCAWIYFQ